MIAVLAIINYRTPFFSTRWRRMVYGYGENWLFRKIEAGKNAVYSIEQLETKK
jgi:hypothetical protein